MNLKKFAIRGLIVLAVAVALCMFFSGTIKTITYNSDTLLKEITVEPAADFRSLKKVSVIL